MRGSSTRFASLKANTNSRPSRIPRRARPAASPTCATMAARSTPARRSRTMRPKASPSFLACRATRCGRSGCSAPGATAATTRAMRPPTPRCCRNISAARCACSICATRARLGSEGHRHGQPQQGRPRRRRQDHRLREHQQRFLAPGRRHQRGPGRRPSRRPSARRSAQAGTELRDSGRLLHVRAQAARLGDRFRR